MEEANIIIEERKKKLAGFFKKNNLWVVGLLVLALILGIYIRSLPMAVRNGNPGLWDITTNTWTLGPDLDPWLFTRYAKTMVDNGSLPRIDVMRNAPLGFDTTIELQMVSYMIVLTYKLVNFFGTYDVNFAAVLMPVIFFALTILSFFFFVREIFTRKDAEDKNLKANIIAIIATFFMIVIPVFLSRTVAGIPEKESVAFFFMFLAFFFFLKAWKSEKARTFIILGLLAGVSTALMGLSWGGVVYIYVTIAIAGFAAFILNKVGRKEFMIYSLWLVSSLIIMLLFTARFSLKDFLIGLDTGLAFFVFFILAVQFIILNTKLKNIGFLSRINLPENIKIFIIAIFLGIISVSVFFGAGFIIEKIKDMNQILFQPVVGRWAVTVAENRQPYFTEWGGSFGPFLRGIPVVFWLFFAGSVVLFKNMLEKIKKKERFILTLVYIVFMLGLIFSRYAAHPSMFDGENFISKFFYYASFLLLICTFLYYYMYTKENNDNFEKIDFEYLFLFSLFILCLFTARSAVRLIMTLGPIAPIFAAYLSVASVEKFRKTKEDTARIFYGIAATAVVLLMIFSFLSFYGQIKAEAKNYIPSYYNYQWQKAMEWVRDETPKEAVFAHWWDYGYWVQSIGNRATITDGGNFVVYWNYLTGRLVLTGNNQKDALDFLYSHNATHLLIDSTDLSKYGAFSSIGSDKDYDRFSSGPPTMIYDPKEIQEKKDGIMRIYQGGVYVDEDIIYEDNGTKIFMPAQRAAIVGILIETLNQNDSVSLKQPLGAFYYQDKQVTIPIRYAYFNKQFIDFKRGIEATAYIVPRVSQTSIDDFGAVMYISPRIMKGLLGQVYILDDPFNKFGGFKLVHSEPSLIISSIESQGNKINEFTYIDWAGLQGPIKIWEIEYTGAEKAKQEYLDTDYKKYIDWKL